MSGHNGSRVDKTEREMNKFEKIVVALLGAIAIAGTVTAVEGVRMARNGFNVTIDIEEAEKIVEQANEAKAAALEDMSKEGE